MATMSNGAVLASFAAGVIVIFLGVFLTDGGTLPEWFRIIFIALGGGLIGLGVSAKAQQRRLRGR